MGKDRRNSSDFAGTGGHEVVSHMNMPEMDMSKELPESLKARHNRKETLFEFDDLHKQKLKKPDTASVTEEELNKI